MGKRRWTIQPVPANHYNKPNEKGQRYKVIKGQRNKVEKRHTAFISQSLCIFFVLYFSVSFAVAEILSERHDSIDFLMDYPSMVVSQSDNTPNIPKLPLDDFTVVEDTKSSLRHEMWQARISIPENKEDERDKNELQQIIERIRSVEFKPRNGSPEPIIVVEPTQKAEPNEILSGTETLEPSKTQAGSKPPYAPVVEQTLLMLDNLLQHPDRISNPLELADFLFYSGHLKEASVFYQEALDRSSPDKADDEAESVLDRAWILFQIGNCLRSDEPSAAIKTYRKLIAEYPNSPWTNLAKARDKLIDWYQKTRPRQLIADVHP